MNAIDFDALERDIRGLHARERAALDLVRAIFERLPAPLPLDAAPVAVRVAVMGQLPPPLTRVKGNKTKRSYVKRTPTAQPIKAARGGVQDQVRSAIEQIPGDFTSREVNAICPKVRRSSISTQLTRWADAGILTKVDRPKTGANGAPSFTYKRGPKWGGTKTVSESVSDSSPSPLGGERAGVRGDSVPTQVPKSGTYPMKVKPNDRLNAIRAIARYFGAKTWLANEMIDELQKRFPHLVDRAEKITGARFQIMELRESGELKSVGAGAARYFTMTAHLADDDAPKPTSTINVPRDPDTAPISNQQ